VHQNAFQATIKSPPPTLAGDVSLNAQLAQRMFCHEFLPISVPVLNLYLFRFDFPFIQTGSIFAGQTSTVSITILNKTPKDAYTIKVRIEWATIATVIATAATLPLQRNCVLTGAAVRNRVDSIVRERYDALE
jgi:hypothetical protein